MKNLIACTLCLLFISKAQGQRTDYSVGLQAMNVSQPVNKFHWRKVQGGHCVIMSPDSARTIVNELRQGVYKFELKITFISGHIAKDTVQVTVLPRKR